MIDYTKILLKNIDIPKLKSKLHSVITVSENTGEILEDKIKLHFCTIEIKKNNIVEFTGSIHKLYNDLKGIKAPNYNKVKTYKGFNGNLFTLDNILEVKSYLCDLFSCEPQQMEFKNIELGINTNVEFNPQIFIKGLLFHNGKSFEFNHNRNYSQVIHQRFYIKIYNKSLQYEMKNHTLRFELKISKSKEIIKTGIKTFADVNSKTLNNAKQMLLNRLNEVIYYDNTINKEILSQSKIKALNKYSNIVYWLDNLKPQHRHREKQKLNNIIANYSKKLKEQIKQEIIKKCVIINRLKSDKKCVIFPPLNNPKKAILKNHKCVIINSSNIGVIITQHTFKNELKKDNKKRPINKGNFTDVEVKKNDINFTINSGIKNTCLVTGLNLDLEGGNAKYIRTTTLKYLQENEKDLFLKLKSDLLKRSFKRPKKENTLIKHLAKQIRNRYYNTLAHTPRMFN